MRIVMIGGNGFIGGSFTEYIQKEDIEIICCDLIGPDKKRKNVSYICMEEEDKNFYRNIINSN